MGTPRYAEVSDWGANAQSPVATFFVYQVASEAEVVRSLVGRAHISIDCGPASVSLRPTVAEMRALIELLEWSIAAEEVAA